MSVLKETTPLTLGQVWSAIEARLVHLEAERKSDRTGNDANAVASIIAMDEVAKVANVLERSLDGGCSITQRDGVHIVLRDSTAGSFHAEVLRRMHNGD